MEILFTHVSMKFTSYFLLLVYKLYCSIQQLYFIDLDLVKPNTKTRDQQTRARHGARFTLCRTGISLVSIPPIWRCTPAGRLASLVI